VKTYRQVDQDLDGIAQYLLSLVVSYDFHPNTLLLAIRTLFKYLQASKLSALNEDRL
jgi:hypothetical protein